MTHHRSGHRVKLKLAHEMLKAEIAIPSNGAPLLKGKLPKDGVIKFNDQQGLDLGAGVKDRVLATPAQGVHLGPPANRHDRHVLKSLTRGGHA